MPFARAICSTRPEMSSSRASAFAKSPRVTSVRRAVLLLAVHHREREAPRASALRKRLLRKTVVGDRLQVRTGFAQPGGALERARVGRGNWNEPVSVMMPMSAAVAMSAVHCTPSASMTRDTSWPRGPTRDVDEVHESAKWSFEAWWSMFTRRARRAADFARATCRSRRSR
jgi:hypothetical protein